MVIRILNREDGGTLLSSLFFLLVLGGFLTVLMFSEELDYAEMKLQQTGDLITKGARSVLTENEATSEEVKRSNHTAEELFQMNKPALYRSYVTVDRIFQRGREGGNSDQYHVVLEGQARVLLPYKSSFIRVKRVSQSER